MKKTVEYEGDESRALRKYGEDKRGFYIEQTEQFIAPHNVMFDKQNPTTQEIDDAEKTLTKMVQDIAEEQQAKAKKACMILADVGISAFSSVKEGQEFVGKFALKKLLRSDTRSLTDKAKAFSQSWDQIKSKLIDKGVVDKGAGLVLNDTAIKARKKDLEEEDGGSSDKQTKAETILSLQIPKVIQEDCEVFNEQVDRQFFTTGQEGILPSGSLFLLPIF